MEDPFCTCKHRKSMHDPNGNCVAKKGESSCACYGYKNEDPDACVNCEHEIGEHSVESVTGRFTYCTHRRCRCRNYIDPDQETPETIGEKTHEVKLGDKLNYNGMIFIITDVSKRLFQPGQMKVKSIEEFMKEFTDEE